MGQKELSVLLKAVVVVLVIFVAAVLLLFIPLLGAAVADYYVENPELSVFFGYVIPVVVAVSAVPVFAALWLGWQIFTQIGKNNSFCQANARRLRLISRLALADTCGYAVMSVIVLALGPKHPSIPLIFVSITLFGAAVTVVCAALSHLTQKAADLKSDNDLTI